MNDESTELSSQLRDSFGNQETNESNFHFDDDTRDSLHRLIRVRRDMRHFKSDSHIDSTTIKKLLDAAHHAPSVGLMQPWRIIRIQDPMQRMAIGKVVETEVSETAIAMGTRQNEFLRLKVEGIRDCAELWVVVIAPDDGTVFGRRTLPKEMALCSVACAIQNIWLAARVEHLGLGWVSMFEPTALAHLLNLPQNAQPLAILCIGPVEYFYEYPMLVQEMWRNQQSLNDLIFTDRWSA